MKLRGRHWLVLWAVMFLAVTGSVALRQQGALRTARALEEARNRRAALEARRADLERRIRLAASREVLVPKVIQRAGLRFSTDTEIVMLRVPHRDPR